MHIESILTKRNRWRYHWLDVLHEWEDDFCRVLGWKLVDDVPLEGRVMSALIQWAPVVARMRKSSAPSFLFAMNPARDIGNGRSNIVPCFVDFFLRGNDAFSKFNEDFKRNKLVLVSSLEALDVLRNEKCPLNVRHLGLSLSDRWVDRAFPFEKSLDLVCMGRPNAVLMHFFEQYIITHPKLTYVVPRMADGRIVLQRHDGTILPSLTERVDYMRLMRSARIGLYATPSIDYGRTDAHGYNQITPRFLEYISSGCHVISRYVDNSDSAYYDMGLMSHRAVTYDDFARAMDRCLNSEIDTANYGAFLSRHVSSARANQLREILQECL